MGETGDKAAEGEQTKVKAGTATALGDQTLDDVKATMPAPELKPFDRADFDPAAKLDSLHKEATGQAHQSGPYQMPDGMKAEDAAKIALKLAEKKNEPVEIGLDGFLIQVKAGQSAESIAKEHKAHIIVRELAELSAMERSLQSMGNSPAANEMRTEVQERWKAIREKGSADPQVSELLKENARELERKGHTREAESLLSIESRYRIPDEKADAIVAEKARLGDIDEGKMPGSERTLIVTSREFNPAIAQDATRNLATLQNETIMLRSGHPSETMLVLPDGTGIEKATAIAERSKALNQDAPEGQKVQAIILDGVRIELNEKGDYARQYEAGKAILKRFEILNLGNRNGVYEIPVEEPAQKFAELAKRIAQGPGVIQIKMSGMDAAITVRSSESTQEISERLAAFKEAQKNKDELSKYKVGTDEKTGAAQYEIPEEGGKEISQKLLEVARAYGEPLAVKTMGASRFVRVSSSDSWEDAKRSLDGAVTEKYLPGQRASITDIGPNETGSGASARVLEFEARKGEKAQAVVQVATKDGASIGLSYDMAKHPKKLDIRTAEGQSFSLTRLFPYNTGLWQHSDGSIHRISVQQSYANGVAKISYKAIDSPNFKGEVSSDKSKSELASKAEPIKPRLLERLGLVRSSLVPNELKITEDKTGVTGFTLKDGTTWKKNGDSWIETPAGASKYGQTEHKDVKVLKNHDNSVTVAYFAKPDPRYASDDGNRLTHTKRFDQDGSAEVRRGDITYHYDKAGDLKPSSYSQRDLVVNCVDGKPHEVIFRSGYTMTRQSPNSDNWTLKGLNGKESTLYSVEVSDAYGRIRIEASNRAALYRAEGAVYKVEPEKMAELGGVRAAVDHDKVVNRMETPTGFVFERYVGEGDGYRVTDKYGKTTEVSGQIVLDKSGVFFSTSDVAEEKALVAEAVAAKFNAAEAIFIAQMERVEQKAGDTKRSEPPKVTVIAADATKIKADTLMTFVHGRTVAPGGEIYTRGGAVDWAIRGSRTADGTKRIGDTFDNQMAALAHTSDQAGKPLQGGDVLIATTDQAARPPYGSVTYVIDNSRIEDRHGQIEQPKATRELVLAGLQAIDQSAPQTGMRDVVMVIPRTGAQAGEVESETDIRNKEIPAAIDEFLKTAKNVKSVTIVVYEGDPKAAEKVGEMQSKIAEITARARKSYEAQKAGADPEISELKSLDDKIKAAIDKANKTGAAVSFSHETVNSFTVQPGKENTAWNQNTLYNEFLDVKKKADAALARREAGLAPLVDMEGVRTTRSGIQKAITEANNRGEAVAFQYGQHLLEINVPKGLDPTSEDDIKKVEAGMKAAEEEYSRQYEARPEVIAAKQEAKAEAEKLLTELKSMASLKGTPEFNTKVLSWILEYDKLPAGLGGHDASEFARGLKELGFSTADKDLPGDISNRDAWTRKQVAWAMDYMKPGFGKLGYYTVNHAEKAVQRWGQEDKAAAEALPEGLKPARTEAQLAEVDSAMKTDIAGALQSEDPKRAMHELAQRATDEATREKLKQVAELPPEQRARVLGMLTSGTAKGSSAVIILTAALQLITIGSAGASPRRSSGPTFETD